jgi:Protein of unknown function (DUF3489)
MAQAVEQAFYPGTGNSSPRISLHEVHLQSVVKALDRQAHTIHGAIAGALKKKLGLDVQSEKDDRRGRVYYIAA